MSTAFISTNSIENAHSSDIYAVVTCPKYTITGSGDGKIIAWNNEDKDASPVVLETASIGVHHLAVDGLGHLLAAVFFDGCLKLYDLHELKPVDAPKLYEEAVDCWAVAFAKQTGTLAYSTVTGLAKVWRVSVAEQEVAQFVCTCDPQSSRKCFATAVDISGDGTLVALGYDNGGIYAFNAELGRLMYSFAGHSNAIRAVKFSPAGKMLAAAGDGMIISLYTMTAGEYVASLTGHKTWVFGLDWNESGEYIVSCSHDGSCKVWSVSSRTCVSTIADSSAAVLAVVWLHKGWGRAVLSGMNEGYVAVGFAKSINWYRQASGMQ